MATILTSDTLVNTYQITRRQNPKHHNLNLYCREGFRCHKINFSFCHKHISVYYIGVQVRLVFHHNSESVAVFLPQKSGVDIRIVYMGYVLDMGHWDCSVNKNFDLRFSIMYQPMLCSHKHSRKNIVHIMTVCMITLCNFVVPTFSAW
jgi:hypothetical protein